MVGEESPIPGALKFPKTFDKFSVKKNSHELENQNISKLSKKIIHEVTYQKSSSTSMETTSHLGISPWSQQLNKFEVATKREPSKPKLVVPRNVNTSNETTTSQIKESTWKNKLNGGRVAYDNGAGESADAVDSVIAEAAELQCGVPSHVVAVVYCGTNIHKSQISKDQQSTEETSKPIMKKKNPKKSTAKGVKRPKPLTAVQKARALQKEELLLLLSNYKRRQEAGTSADLNTEGLREKHENECSAHSNKEKHAASTTNSSITSITTDSSTSLVLTTTSTTPTLNLAINTSTTSTTICSTSSGLEGEAFLSSTSVVKELHQQNPQGILAREVAEMQHKIPPTVAEDLNYYLTKTVDYRSNAVTGELNKQMEKLLSRLVKYQRQDYSQNPIKARAKRRYAVGLQETGKHVHKVSLLLVAANISKNQQLNANLLQLLQSARQHGIPIVFGLTCVQLGRLTCGVQRRLVCCVGVLNHKRAENVFIEILRLLPEAQRLREERKIPPVKIYKTAIPNELSSVTDTGVVATDASVTIDVATADGDSAAAVNVTNGETTKKRKKRRKRKLIGDSEISDSLVIQTSDPRTAVSSGVDSSTTVTPTHTSSHSSSTNSIAGYSKTKSSNSGSLKSESKCKSESSGSVKGGFSPNGTSKNTSLIATAPTSCSVDVCLKAGVASPGCKGVQGLRDAAAAAAAVGLDSAVLQLNKKIAQLVFTDDDSIPASVTS